MNRKELAEFLVDHISDLVNMVRDNMQDGEMVDAEEALGDVAKYVAKLKILLVEIGITKTE